MADAPEITTVELAGALGISIRAVEMQIRNLRDAKMIRRVGAAKGGHWEVLQ